MCGHSYCSLPQRKISGEDDRTSEEHERFGRALKGINAWYGHQKATVLLVTSDLPAGHEYINTQPYEGRGWCVAEKRMSAIVKDQDALIDIRQLTGDEATVKGLIKNGKSKREPPMAPDLFHAMLKNGVTDQSIKFTKAGDVDVVADIYRRAFLDEMSAASSLEYGGLGWGAEQMTTLFNALGYAGLETLPPLKYAAHTNKHAVVLSCQQPLTLLDPLPC